MGGGGGRGGRADAAELRGSSQSAASISRSSTEKLAASMTSSAAVSRASSGTREYLRQAARHPAPQRRDGRQLPPGRFHPADHAEAGEQRRQPVKLQHPARGQHGQRAAEV